MIRTILLAFITSYIFPAAAQNVWNNKRAAVVLTYDDGIDGNLDIVVPALDSSGFKGTFYVIGNAPVISKRMEEWRKAAANGHELGNHTLFHPCNGGPGRGFITDETDLRKYTVDRAVREIRLTNTLLTAIDGKKTRTFAYPCGDLKIGDALYYKPLVGDFAAARGVTGAMNSISNINLEDVNSYVIINHSGKYMTDLVDEAIKSGSLVVFLFHGVGGGHSLNVELKEHRELLRHLKKREKDVWVATMVDVAEFVNSEREESPIEYDMANDKTASQNKIINRLQFSIEISADKEKIWRALWGDKQYRDWAGVFGEGSHYLVDNWEAGNKIMFLASDKSGIYSVIERHIPYKIIQFKHIGNVVNGQEQPVDDEVKKWSGATETYSLKEGKGFYTLLVEIDVLDEHVEFMSTKLPIALEKIKKNSR